MPNVNRNLILVGHKMSLFLQAFLHYLAVFHFRLYHISKY